MVPVWQGDTLHQVRAAAHVFATGTISQPLVFAGNDLPGVMLAEGALRLATLYAIAPGRRAVLVTVDDRGLEAAAALREPAGVEILAVADLRPSGPALPGVEVLQGHTIVAATGSRSVVSGGRARSAGRRPASAVSRATSCCCPAELAPAASLLLQAGARAVVRRRPTGGLQLSGLPGRRVPSPASSWARSAGRGDRRRSGARARACSPHGACEPPARSARRSVRAGARGRDAAGRRRSRTREMLRLPV